MKAPAVLGHVRENAFKEICKRRCLSTVNYALCFYLWRRRWYANRNYTTERSCWILILIFIRISIPSNFKIWYIAGGIPVASVIKFKVESQNWVAGITCTFARCVVRFAVMFEFGVHLCPRTASTHWNMRLFLVLQEQKNLTNLCRYYSETRASLRISRSPSSVYTQFIWDLYLKLLQAKYEGIFSWRYCNGYVRIK